MKQQTLTQLDAGRIDTFLSKYNLSTSILNLKVGMELESSLYADTPTSVIDITSNAGMLALIMKECVIQTYLTKEDTESGMYLTLVVDFKYQHNFSGGSNGKRVCVSWRNGEDLPSVVY